jgi:glyoxylase-like metal-dependent hydrolase (beta-lactamase superfamily II)
MVTQLPLDRELVIARPHSGDTCEVAPDIACLRLAFVNVVLCGDPNCGDRGWVLIDCGVRGYRKTIEEAAAKRFGVGARPAAILLTHGHFDHVGSVEELSRSWDVPVYVHYAESPYLDGSESYPPADPFAGGGLMSLLSPLFPRGPVEIGERLRLLPQDRTVPGLSTWEWIATPGHTPGHVSFWNAERKILIAGDACITTGQESAYEAAVQTPEMHGPPRYFTPDWDRAAASVRKLAGLGAECLVAGHGPPLRGEGVGDAIGILADRFDEIARPRSR